MSYLSQEHKNRLIEEHKLVNVSLGRLTSRYAQYATQNGADAVAAANTSLRARKVELELMIDALSEFLEG